MKLSNNYILYPDNRALERAIASSLGMLGNGLLEAATPDNKVTVADNFLYTRGNYEQHRFSSNILDSVREALAESLTDQYRDQEPLAWAETQNSLGNILAAQGQQQRDVELYEKAIECFNNALEEFKQEKSPLDWAATQNNLGNALMSLGTREGGTKRLEEAVTTLQGVLKVYTQELMPLEWAST